MTHPQGSVVLAPASFKDGVRPYLVVSNDRRPFQGAEYTIATITTTERNQAVTVSADDLTAGRLARYPSFVNPWGLHVVRDEHVKKRVARVSAATLDRVSTAACSLVEPI